MTTRRQLLRTLGVGALAGIGGCAGTVSDDAPSTSNATARNTTTAADETTTTTKPSDAAASERFHLGGTDVLEDFEDLSAWSATTGSVEASDDAFRGSQAMRVTGSKADGFAWASRSVDWDLSGKTLSLAVNPEAPVDNVVVTVRLLTPDTNNYVMMSELMRIRPNQGWMRLDLATRDFEGSPDFSSVEQVEVGMRAADGDIDFVVDDLRSVPRPEKGRVVFSFDDSLRSHYTEAFRVLDEHDMRGNVGVITGDVGSDGSLTLDQMSEMQDAGWEFASHGTRDASFIDLSTQKMWLEVNDAHDWLTSHGFSTGADSFVYPHGEYDDRLVDYIEKYHEAGFRYLDPLSAGSGRITDPFTIGRGNAAYSLTDSKLAVNYAANFRNLTVFTFHGIDDGSGLSMATEDFENLVQYVDERDVEVITFSELTDEFVLD